MNIRISNKLPNLNSYPIIHEYEGKGYGAESQKLIFVRWNKYRVFWDPAVYWDYAVY